MVYVPEGDLRRQRVEAVRLVQHRDMSKRRIEELPWSTGLLDVWRDPELLSMSLTGACPRRVAAVRSRLPAISNGGARIPPGGPVR